MVTSLLLWILGLLLLTLFKGAGIKDELRANANYIVELNPMILPGQRIIAESLLKYKPGVIASSVTLVDKETARSIMIPDFPHLADSQTDNPFRDIIQFKVAGLSDDQIVELKDEILGIQGVASFYYEQEVFNGLEDGIGRIRLALLVLSSILLFAVVLIIVYALHRVLLQNKEHSQVLHLAGVLDKDIIFPYVKSGVRSSIMCSSLAIIILVLNILLINKTLLTGVEISYLQVGITCLLLVLISISIYVGTTYYATRSFIHNI